MADFTPTIIALISIAVGPFLIYAIKKMKSDTKLWTVFLFGWGGWMLAFFMRIFLVQIPGAVLSGQISSNTMIAFAYILYASGLAGFFEEGIRYIFLSTREEFTKKLKPLYFGLGWGLGEVFIIYVPSIMFLHLSPVIPGFPDIMAGAFERNFAILAHIAFTFIIAKQVTSNAKNKKYLVYAILAHTLLNVIAVSSLLFTGNVWFTEFITAAVVIFYVYMARRVWKK